MDAGRRYIKDKGFDVSEDFVESLSTMDILTGIKIAKFIDEEVDAVEINTLVSTVLGGVVVDNDDEPITFALEIIKDQEKNIILSDIKMVSMDEYLDLINLNKKSNGITKSKGSKELS
jgi:CheY-like chemotaxis protein